MTAREHNKLVGIFLMAHGAFQGLMMIFVGLIYGAIGSAILVGGNRGDEKMVGVVFIALVFVIALFSLLILVPQIVGGYKMWKEKANARSWGIIGSILSVLSFPLGTAVGVYGMWFLFGDEGKQYYLGNSHQPAFASPPKPPLPNSWQ